MSKRLSAEKQLCKALAALDTAVQRWYEENAPENKEHYASCHIRNYPFDSEIGHVSDITLRPDKDKDDYIEFYSSKHGTK